MIVTKLDAMHTDENGNTVFLAADSKVQKPRRRGPLCHFYRKGTCRNGEACGFAHLPKKSTEELFRDSNNIEMSSTGNGSGFVGDALASSDRLNPLNEFALPSNRNQRASHNLSHQILQMASNMSHSLSTNSEHSDAMRDSLTIPDRPRPVRTNRMCRYFVTEGWCVYGDACHFLHEQRQHHQSNGSDLLAKSLTDSISSDAVESVRSSAVSSPALPVAQYLFSAKDLNDEAINLLRSREIHYLQRRFHSSQTLIDDCLIIDFSATDPDWPFDVKSVKLVVNLQKTYPVQPAVIIADDDQPMPYFLIQHISQTVCDWLNSRHAINKERGDVELVMRAFFRWFDRSMQQIFTDGLKKCKMVFDAQKAGISVFTPSTNLKKAGSADSFEFDETDELSNGLQAFDDESSDENGVGEMQSDDNDRPGFDHDDAAPQTDVTAASGKTAISGRKATEAIFRSFLLSESVGIVTPVRLSLMVSCLRCKQKNDYETPLKVEENKEYPFACSKCHLQGKISIESAVLHRNALPGVFAYIKTLSCNVADVNLMRSEINISCIECNADTSVKGVMMGQPITVWCRQCHEKLTVNFEGLRFNRPHNLDIAEGQLFNLPRLKKKQIEDTQLVAGQPLPKQGTCIHYKKSFRWFRFPCCGKVYPCDVCHEENESHEMQFASRMICGFCSKEQPYSANKPCISCSSNVTKLTTAHWEGGKGCRNVKKMSRNDVKKYSNQSKTVSRKAQEKL